MGVSGFWGAYLTERAERKFDVLEKGLKRTSRVVKENMRTSLIIGLVDGLSPFLSMIALIIPFFLLPIPWSYFASFSLAVVLVSLLGVLIARIGRQSIIKSILRMLSATLAIIVILYLLASIGLV
ncbi:MAG: hypothetical protein JW791_04310 [Nanoarchaeota archaeon]|nr:hypothetical protein [Nanoarchaeota archaeon]